MKKKDYIIPGITVTTVQVQLLQVAVSSGSDGISSDPNDDTELDDNRSRRVRNVWEDEELEEEEEW